MSEPAKVPLSQTEAAFVALVLEEHQSNIALADQTRDRRMIPLLSDKQIPPGVKVTIEREGDQSYLTYQVPS